MWYETIKRYYQKEMYTKEQLEVFVRVKMISEKQMQEIITSKESAAQ